MDGTKNVKYRGFDLLNLSKLKERNELSSKAARPAIRVLSNLMTAYRGLLKTSFNYV